MDCWIILCWVEFCKI